MTPTEWFGKMKEIWLAQDPNRMAELLADTLEYHENPLETPLRTIQAVVDAWKEIKDQNIEYVEIEMLYENESVAMALWRFKQVNQPEHIGSYFLKLNNQGRCVEFRQWWSSR